MWGNPSHLAELQRIIKEVHFQPTEEGLELHTLVAATNSDEHTYDGIDWGGERVAEEIYDEVQKLKDDGKTVVRFSVTGYSLGGLVARYLVGILQQRRFFDNVTPVNFNTVATPHIGLLKYRTFLYKMFSKLGPHLLSRTGEQFYCVDKWSARGRPLLEVMADPDRIFYQALASFTHIRIYANAIFDMTVPYITSAIDLQDPFMEWQTNGLHIEFDEQYFPLLKSWELPSEPPVIEKPTLFSSAWWRQLKPERPIFQIGRLSRFPYNILFYVAFPIIIPLFISLAIIRLSTASRSSRSRIKLLETDDSSKSKLVHVIATLEKDMEDAFADFMDDPDAPIGGVVHDTHSPSAIYPKLTPLQRRMAASLNRLPLKKERAFIQGVRNSHAVIVSRNVKDFDFHRIGEGVIRHWADSFIL
ncbi:DUF676-domain-containing protein [Fistulina hepatica ATCC 64428]|uniref:DUF676-domain-containing protein n=1 Tax=Fistulina hepatica ATCC 64428 TaxID=1128425 RepID=A0A0D7AP72_9AGAR|nr:DUF676-domain-containing protein [Fistulina hepatica ATCC 64428]